MALDDYDDLDAVGLAGRIAARDVSALEVLEAAISRLEERNPALNAIVDRLYDEARKTIAAGLPEGSLSGVPYLMKGLGLFMAGVRCTQGSRLFADFVADHDSTIVSRVRQAGLVVFGTTNSPEFGLNSTTEPAAHGPTHNPWNLAFSPGGSSGGSGAAVAARIVPAANASDGGGSIRIPASNCGLVGLKVSRGRTPSGPDSGEGWAGLANEHALTRTVRDSAAILDATHGPAPGDPYFAKAPKRPFLDEVGRDPGQLRIALMTAPPDGRAVDDACVKEARKAAKLCESLGHSVEEAGPAFDFEAMLQAFRVVVAGSVRLGIEMRLNALGRESRQGDIENITKTWSEEGASHSARDFAEAVFTLHQVARDFGEFFEDYDVLLSPTLARVPMKLGERPMDGTDLDVYWAHQCDIIPFTTPYNAAGAPAISLPLGWTADGLPVGVQFGAAMGNEGLLLRLASQIETAAPWANRRPD